MDKPILVSHPKTNLPPEHRKLVTAMLDKLHRKYPSVNGTFKIRLIGSYLPVQQRNCTVTHTALKASIAVQDSKGDAAEYALRSDHISRGEFRKLMASEFPASCFRLEPTAPERQGKRKPKAKAKPKPQKKRRIVSKRRKTHRGFSENDMMLLRLLGVKK